ncbi:N-acetyl-gamma-glutamyl-phosphate reductase, partial [bacterium]|nr:N-acetyl-gamma-glutamyl-phosphate reductase [bacterium]
MAKLQVSIVGGSGYTGGELTRLLLFHREVELKQVTSERFNGKSVFKAHPNLRNVTDLKYCSIDDLEETEVLFLCLPHGQSMRRIRDFQNLATKIVDLSGDFRLNNVSAYEKWYGKQHTHPELLPEFVYGIPELHRETMRTATRISSAGCNATAVILALYPLFKHGLVDLDRTVIEVKGGSSEGGNSPSESSHHPERNDTIRSYKPTQHRHAAEAEQ